MVTSLEDTYANRSIYEIIEKGLKGLIWEDHVVDYML